MAAADHAQSEEANCEKREAGGLGNLLEAVVPYDKGLVVLVVQHPVAAEVTWHPARIVYV